LKHSDGHIEKEFQCFFRHAGVKDFSSSPSPTHHMMDDNNSDNATLSQHISAALNATLNPRVPNNVRQQALQHLEAVKSQPDAPQHGFTLADDFSQNDAVRYYGLQLLEFAVRYRWNEYTTDQTDQLRTWVKCLAGSLREVDARLLRNKIAQLWVEVAKRCWGDDEWMDMDQMLLNLWESDGKGASNKLLVLGILEALSEDIINHEDAVAGLRLDVLGHALNEIMIPQRLYAQHQQTRGASERQEVRCGEEGWLGRMCEFFGRCVREAKNGRDVALYEDCAMKALNALRPTMSWINLKAAQEINCVDCLFVPLHTDNVGLQTAAIEVLYALLSRPYNVHFKETWSVLLKSVLRRDRMMMVRQAFEHAMTGPGEDDDKYTLLKKMSELLSVLADAIALQTDGWVRVMS
jgi:exportin-5